jgi:hypothetical protein
VGMISLRVGLLMIINSLSIARKRVQIRNAFQRKSKQVLFLISIWQKISSLSTKCYKIVRGFEKFLVLLKFSGNLTFCRLGSYPL